MSSRAECTDAREERRSWVPIAQLDRALDCGSKGRRFESSWARKIPGTVLVGSGTSVYFADLDVCWVSVGSGTSVYFADPDPSWVSVGSGTSVYFADLDPSWVSERCESGRIGRSRKPLSCLRLRGFESHSLRELFFTNPAGEDPGRVTPLGSKSGGVLGEMTEWPKVHAWKACVLVRVPWVRLPLSPYNPFGVDIQVIRYELLPKSVRPGREQR